MKQVEPRSSAKKRIWQKMLPPFFGTVLIFAIVAGLWPKPIEVETAEIDKGPLSVFVLEEGKTRIRQRYTVSPPFLGSLKRINLRAGDRIEAGKTVLAEVQGEWAGFINPRLFAESEVRVKATEAARLRSKEEVERAQAALELAKKERARSESLKESGVISKREWDAALNQVELLTREVKAAEYSNQVAEFEHAQAEVALRQVQGPLDGGEGVYRIISPITGVVLNVFEESSKFVAAGTPLLEVGDTKNLEAEIELLSSDAVGVSVGAPVSIENWGGDKPLSGRVAVIEPSGFTKISSLGVEEQRVKVRVDFEGGVDGEKTLGDRFRVEARILVWSSPEVLRVPTGALFRRGGEWQVFVLEGERVRVVSVGVGHNNGSIAEVLSGLNAGQKVVLHAPDALVAGKAVRPRSGVPK